MTLECSHTIHGRGGTEEFAVDGSVVAEHVLLGTLAHVHLAIQESHASRSQTTLNGAGFDVIVSLAIFRVVGTHPFPAGSGVSGIEVIGRGVAFVDGGLMWGALVRTTVLVGVALQMEFGVFGGLTNGDRGLVVGVEQIRRLHRCFGVLIRTQISHRILFAGRFEHVHERGHGGSYGGFDGSIIAVIFGRVLTISRGGTIVGVGFDRLGAEIGFIAATAVEGVGGGL